MPALQIPPNIAAMMELERRGKLPPELAAQLLVARQQGVVKPMAGAAMTPEQVGKAKGKLASMDMVETQLNDVEALYGKNLKGDPTGTYGAFEYLPLPNNKTFDTAATAILPLVRQALSTSAKDGDSDRELAVWQSLIPNSSEYDEVNEQRIKQMRSLIDKTRATSSAMLGPPARPALTGAASAKSSVAPALEAPAKQGANKVIRFEDMN